MDAREWLEPRRLIDGTPPVPCRRFHLAGVAASRGVALSRSFNGLLLERGFSIAALAALQAGSAAASTSPNLTPVIRFTSSIGHSMSVATGWSAICSGS